MSQKRKTILWITDPWSTLDHPLDTTLRLMQESLALGRSVYWCDTTQIEYSSANGCQIHVQQLIRADSKRNQESFKFGPAKKVKPSVFSKIFYRADPPVDTRYLHPYLLLHNDPGCPELTPPPALVLGSTEKIEAMKFGKFSAVSLISQNPQSFQKFSKRYESIVIKPLNEAQSKGVSKLETSDSERIGATASRSQGYPLVAQQFLGGIFKGETRLWFVNGHYMGCVRKLPSPGEFKIDMDRGGTVASHQLTQQEKRAVPLLTRYLKKNKVRLAAVDLIDGKITDLNYTSPGLLIQMEKVLGINLAKQIISAL